MPENEPRVILATGSYIGEGFDDTRLNTLFLAMPISGKGTLQQYVGRLHWLHDNKRVVQVYDYVDDWVPMLERMYQRRLKGYGSIGYTIDHDVSISVALTAPLIGGHKRMRQSSNQSGKVRPLSLENPLNLKQFT